MSVTPMPLTMGAGQFSSRGDSAPQIRACRLSIHRYNAACLSLTPRLSWVWATVLAPKPLQRFTQQPKPLKRLGDLFACHTHPAAAHGSQGNYCNRLNLLHGAHLLALLLPSKVLHKMNSLLPFVAAVRSYQSGSGQLQIHAEFVQH